MNTFLLDKEFSRKYEYKIAEELKNKMPNKVIALNDIKGNDEGCDIFVIDLDEIYCYDIKAYKPPKFIKEFKGFYLETKLVKSGRPGWLLDNDKITTHYVLLKNCYLVNGIGYPKYEKCYIISKKDLAEVIMEAEMNGDIIKSKCQGESEGLILPYKYLEKYEVK